MVPKEICPVGNPAALFTKSLQQLKQQISPPLPLSRLELANRAARAHSTFAPMFFPGGTGMKWTIYALLALIGMSAGAQSVKPALPQVTYIEPQPIQAEPMQVLDF